MSGEPDVFNEELDCNNGDEVSCNLDNIYTNLKNGLIGNDDVDLNCFLRAYKELFNFFIVLGGAFQFVASDVKSKIKIIEDLQNEEKLNTNKIQHFSSIKSMILYEEEKKLLLNQKYVSGCRTLLRLHRGLDFVRHFFKEIFELKDDAKVGGVCRESYDKTLAVYHAWVVKNSARLAMKLLPTREVLLKKMSKNNTEELKRAMNIMPELLDVMNICYDRVQKLYSEHELLDLP